MSIVKEIFGEESYWYDYQPIIEHFGRVVAQYDDGDYQGDTHALLSLPNGRVGYLCFGWGSCSGCDALQACSSEAEVEELINQLRNEIVEFDDVPGFLEWAADTEAREAQWWWHTDGLHTLIERVKEMNNESD